ncbi:hypothetical protein [Malikia spinosa]|uniref:hypothetical protein n=1 Tax=Malikia spinosa TaxID=86180 RepID=UPI0027BABE8A|nr:hypothetical protein [Malikia spinosa]
MLVILDESLATELEQGAGSADAVLSALGICAQAAIEGAHILFADRAVYKRLRVFHSQLGRRTAAVLLRAEDRLPQLGQMRSFVQRALRVAVVPPPGLPHKIQCDKRAELVLPAGLIDQHSSLLAVPALIVENLNDGRCFIKIAESVVASGFFPDLSWLQVVPIRSKIEPGGGNTLGNLFAYVKAGGDRIGLAIADSDIRYPGGSFGDTATALTKEVNTFPISPLLEHHILGVRTIENCIPRAAIRSIAADLDPVQLCRFDRQVNDFAATPFWNLLPIKSGVKCFEVDRTNAESKFWTELLGGRQCHRSNI